MNESLPIQDIMPELKEKLKSHATILLQAPPE